MLQAMFNGVSGVQAHKTQLDVIGNNVANVNTIAFKGSRTVFKDVVSQTIRSSSQPTENGLGGTNPFQIGLGVFVGASDVNMAQGSMQPTGRVTDIAIEGNGFLMATDGIQKYYTRDGSFYLDSAGYLVATGSGFHVLGWHADPETGEINNSDTITEASVIRVLVGQMSIAKGTTEVDFGGNLNASRALGGSVPPKVFDIYDSHGVAHKLSMNFVKSSAPSTFYWYADCPDRVSATSARITPAGNWTAPAATSVIALNHTNVTIQPTDTIHTFVDKINAAGAGVVATTDGTRVTLTSQAKGSDVAITMTPGGGYTMNDIFGAGHTVAAGTGAPIGHGLITFDAFGNPLIRQGAVSITLANPDGAVNPMNIAIDFSRVTMLAGEDTVDASRQDGLALGTLESYSIGKDGIITGRFTNGLSKSLAQLAMADFRNSAGLAKAGNNLWLETSNSGLAQIGPPANGSRGRIASGFLEISNVDLPTEFTNMIIAQRGFQANARLITTSDEVLQELVQLKR